MACSEDAGVARPSREECDVPPNCMQSTLLSGIKAPSLAEIFEMAKGGASQLLCIECNLLSPKKYSADVLYTCIVPQAAPTNFPGNIIDRGIDDLCGKCDSCQSKCKGKEKTVHPSKCESETMKEPCPEIERPYVIGETADHDSDQVVENGRLVQESSHNVRSLVPKERYMLRIHSFYKYLHEARHQPNTEYFFNSFVTGSGYKIKFVIYPNGTGIDKDKDISVGYVLMRGDDDDNVHWPFDMEVTFSIFGPRSNKLNRVTRIPPDTRSVCNQRPEDKNICRVVTFIPICEVDQVIDGQTIHIVAALGAGNQNPGASVLSH